MLQGTDDAALMELGMVMPENFIRGCRELADHGLEEEREEEEEHRHASSVDRTTRLERKFARALDRSGMPLSSFDNDCWKDFFEDSGQFKPPPRARLAGSLLNSVYEVSNKEVQEVIDTQGRGNYTLNLISDESDAMNKDRITNLFLNTNDDQSFHRV